MRAIDVFEKVDKNEFAEELAKRYPKYYPTTEKALRHFDIFMKDAHSKPLDELDEKEINDGFVLTGIEYYSDEDTDVVKDENNNFVAPDVDFDKVPKHICVDGIYLRELIEKKDILNMQVDELMKGNIMPLTNYGIDFIDRHHVLAYEIIPTFIDRYGLTIVAVELFFEFTFYGLVSEQVKAESDKLVESTEEIQIVRDYAKEHNITIDEASEILGITFVAKDIEELFANLNEEENDDDEEESKPLTEEEIKQQKEFEEWIKETNENPTYKSALMKLTMTFANKNRQVSKDFYMEYLENYKDSELLKKFL